MNIYEFAKKHNVRITKSTDDGMPIIQGSVGHIYEYSSEELGLMFLPPGNPRPRFWNSIKKQCLSERMTLMQDCDAEGTVSFDPDDNRQARLAIKEIGARPKKQISEAHKASLLAGLQRAKQRGQEAILEEVLAG